MIKFLNNLLGRADWDEFCAWLNEYLEVEPNILPIKWQKCYSPNAGKIVRFDFAPGKPYQVITAIEDESSTCDRDHAYMLANRVRPFIEKAIKEKSPTTVLWTY